MPSEEKVIKLSQARTLYNDLRSRIENAVTNQIATVEETMEIISEYNSIGEDDEGMVFNANYDDTLGGFITEEDGETILNAYISGKHVVIHCVDETNDIHLYVSIIAYEKQDDYIILAEDLPAYMDKSTEKIIVGADQKAPDPGEITPISPSEGI